MMSKSDHDKTDTKNPSAKEPDMARRQFMQKASLGAAAGVGALALGGKNLAAKPETADERKRARYKETDHVKSFYETCSF